MARARSQSRPRLLRSRTRRSPPKPLRGVSVRTPCALRGIVSRSPEEHLGCALKETPVDSSDFDHETIFDEIAAARAAVLAGAHASDLEVIDAPAATAVSPSARAGNPEKL